MFTRKNDILHVEELSLVDLAKEYGTPLYVYSKKQLDKNIANWADHLEPTDTLCYAVKANPNINLMNIIAQQGHGFDVVSKGELMRIEKIDADMQKVIFSGIGKTTEEIDYAIDCNIKSFNVESEQELNAIERIAADKGRIAPISIRVNPNIQASTHPYISTGLKENKFGIDIDKALELYDRAHKSKSLAVQGIACHIGSQITDITPLLEATRCIGNIVKQLEVTGINLQYIDLGGGIGVDYSSEDKIPDIGAYISQVRTILPNIPFIFEPGRSIVATSCLMITEVIYIKSTQDKNFAIVDAAMNDCMRPALYNAWMKIENVHTTQQGSEIYDVVGPICESGDFLGKDRKLTLDQGSLLCVRHTGAYCSSMASNYNSRPKAAGIMVDGDKVSVIRAREKAEQLWDIEDNG